MSLHNCFHHKGRLPTTKDTRLTSHTTAAANKCIKELTLKTGQGPSRKQWYTTTSTDKDRARISRYAAENDIAKAVKHFKSSYEDLSENTVQHFKKLYLKALSKQCKARELQPTVKTVSIKSEEGLYS